MNATEIIAATCGVTKRWAKQRKAEERQSNRIFSRASVMMRSCRTTIKEAAWDGMEAAYMKASSNGQYPAHARQIMYAARPDILRLTEKDGLDDAYFTQQLLPEFMREHSDLTAKWDVVFDARGSLSEPHTDRRIPLGTLDVRSYLSEIGLHAVDEYSVEGPETLYPTAGPGNRYGAILFIEKEGFMPLFQKARLAARYDIAIMSTKGVSVTASRSLVDALCHTNIPLLVLHDFDKSGFSILGTLRRDTRRYSYRNAINVIDLGIRLDDVHGYDLQDEACTFGRSDPRTNLKENSATKEEIDFLCSDCSYHSYSGRRVELNAFTSGDFLQWIESKLKKAGVKKVIPDGETLKVAYRRMLLAHRVGRHLESYIKEEKRRIATLDLRGAEMERYVKKALRKTPHMPWDHAITDIVADEEGFRPGDGGPDRLAAGPQ